MTSVPPVSFASACCVVHFQLPKKGEEPAKDLLNQIITKRAELEEVPEGEVAVAYRTCLANEQSALEHVLTEADYLALKSLYPKTYFGDYFYEGAAPTEFVGKVGFPKFQFLPHTVGDFLQKFGSEISK